MQPRGAARRNLPIAAAASGAICRRPSAAERNRCARHGRRRRRQKGTDADAASREQPNRCCCCSGRLDYLCGDISLSRSPLSLFAGCRAQVKPKLSGRERTRRKGTRRSSATEQRAERRQIDYQTRRQHSSRPAKLDCRLLGRPSASRAGPLGLWPPLVRYQRSFCGRCACNQIVARAAGNNLVRSDVNVVVVSRRVVIGAVSLPVGQFNPIGSYTRTYCNCYSAARLRTADLSSECLPQSREAATRKWARANGKHMCEHTHTTATATRAPKTYT